MNVWLSREFAPAVGLLGYARCVMAGRCSAMAASMAASSSSKSGVSGTPTKSSPCSCALMAYITKPGTGASTTGRCPSAEGGIDIKCNFNLWNTSSCWRDTIKSELSK